MCSTAKILTKLHFPLVATSFLTQLIQVRADDHKPDNNTSIALICCAGVLILGALCYNHHRRGRMPIGIAPAPVVAFPPIILGPAINLQLPDVTELISEGP